VKKKTIVALVLLSTFIAGVLPPAFAEEDTSVLITPNGAVREVSGSCYHVQFKDVQFLVDCGQFYPDGEPDGGGSFEEAERMVSEKDKMFTFEPDKIDFLLVTHAHLDHIGRIPLLKKMGFNGPVYCTQATKELSGIMLAMAYQYNDLGVEDFVKSKRSDVVHSHPLCSWRNKIAERNLKHVKMNRVDVAERGWRICKECARRESDELLELFQTYPYRTHFSPAEGITIEFYNAGHIPGAASILVELGSGAGEKTLLFSGDLGNDLSPIVPEPTPPEFAEYVFIESTYGDVVRPVPDVSYKDFKEEIGNDIRSNKIIWIPAFVLDRTQKVLVEICEGKEDGIIPYEAPIYVASSWAKEITEAYDGWYCGEDRSFLRPEIYRLNTSPFDHSGLNYSYPPKGADGPYIFLSSTRIMDYEFFRDVLKERLSDPQTTIVFVGYMDEQTVGGKIKKAAESRQKHIELDGDRIKLKCKVKYFSEFSGHADARELVEWVSSIDGVEKIFIVHGEEKSAVALKSRLERHLPEADVIIPEQYTTFTIH